MEYTPQEKEKYSKFRSMGMTHEASLEVVNKVKAKNGDTVETKPANPFLRRAANRVVDTVKDIPDDIQAAGSAIKQSFDRGVDRVSDPLAKYIQGEQGFGSSLLQVTGETLRTGANIVGDAFVGAASLVTTEEDENKIKEGLGKVVGQAMDSEVVQNAMDKYNEFKRNNPEKAANLEARLGFVEAALEVTGLGIAKRTGTAALRGTKQGLNATIDGANAARRAAGEFADNTIDGVKGGINNVKESITSGNLITDAKNLASKVTEPVGKLEDIAADKLLSNYSADDLIHRAVKPRIIKGKNLKNTKAKAEIANRTVLEYGFKPTSMAEFGDAVTKSKKQIWDQVIKGVEDARGTGAKVEIKSIAERIKQVADDPAIALTDPGEVKVLKELAENLISQGDEVAIDVAQRMKQIFNSQLSKKFGEFTVSDLKVNALKEINTHIGKQIDELIDSIPVKDLKKKYGALSEIEDDIYKRVVVASRQNPEGLLKGFSRIEGAANVFSGLIGRNPALAGKGLAQAVGGRIVGKLNDGDSLIKTAFERLAKEKGVGTKKAASEAASQSNNLAKTSTKGTVVQTAKQAPETKVLELSGGKVSLPNSNTKALPAATTEVKNLADELTTLRANSKKLTTSYRKAVDTFDKADTKIKKLEAQKVMDRAASLRKQNALKIKENLAAQKKPTGTAPKTTKALPAATTTLDIRKANINEIKKISQKVKNDPFVDLIDDGGTSYKFNRKSTTEPLLMDKEFAKNNLGVNNAEELNDYLSINLNLKNKNLIKTEAQIKRDSEAIFGKSEDNLKAIEKTEVALESIKEPRYRFGTDDKYVYHTAPKNVDINSFKKSGIKPSTEGAGGPGVYMANTPENTLGYTISSLDEAITFRIKKDDLIKKYGLYPENPNGVQYDSGTKEILLDGKRNIPPEFIEFSKDGKTWEKLK